MGAAVLLSVLWVGLTTSFNWQELTVGAIAVGFTVAFFLQVLRTETLSFDLRARDLWQARHLPAEIAKDCWVVMAVLLRDLLGQQRAGSFYRVCGFKTSSRDPLLVGRSALAVTYGSMSPNLIALGIDPGQSLMVFHQLQRAEPSAMLHALGAAPGGPKVHPERGKEGPQ